ncbi:hypothetical protein [Lactobacillus sp. PV012]|uniref:hypothetical protein n=1 Tax=Lactobacillus sp. PV012 TaxID=2594494 RepID=UPI00223F16DF|nr:hypothetical protein [Lactobacillus sp. PV012]QNQ82211.1 hypothetical protein FP433_03750 [Lactobacillus sp. PV012]
MVNKKKLKKLLHQKSKTKISFKKKVVASDEEEISDYDTHIPIAKKEDIKKNGETHELNKIRRLTAKKYLNKFRYSASDHSLIKYYYYLREWFDWTGIIADISMPTGNDSTKLDGKVLIDKFCYYDKNSGKKELLDHHIWLNVNNIRYLMSGSKLTLGIGDVIQASSRIMQYSGNKGTVEKFGLGSTIIHAGGVTTSHTNFTNKNSQTIISNYDHGDDWVLKLDNSGVPDTTIENYQSTNDIRFFANREHGHVLATYQPSRYQHYFERLQESESDSLINQNPTERVYTGTIYDLRVYEENGEAIPKLVFEKIENSIGRIVCARRILEYNEELRRLGTLYKGDKLSFTYSGNDFDNIKIEDLHKIKRLSSHSNYKLPRNKQLLAGWIMKTFYYGPTQDYDLVGKYLHWQQISNGEDAEIDEEDFDKIYGLTVSEIARKLHLSRSKVQDFLETKYPNSGDVLYSIIDLQDNEHRYYKPEVLEEVENHLKYKGVKAQSALERVKATKNNYSHQVKEKISAIPKAKQKPELSENEIEQKFLAGAKQQSAPKDQLSEKEKSQDKLTAPVSVGSKEKSSLEDHKPISEEDKVVKQDAVAKENKELHGEDNSNFTVKLICETGSYTSTQFQNYGEAINFFQKGLELNKLNQFLLVTDKNGQESLISIKQILEIKPAK